jgi:hypothetical protein
LHANQRAGDLTADEVALGLPANAFAADRARPSLRRDAGERHFLDIAAIGARREAMTLERR